MTSGRWKSIVINKIKGIMTQADYIEKHPEEFKDTTEQIEAVLDLQEELIFLQFAHKAVKQMETPLIFNKPKLLFPLKGVTPERAEKYMHN